MLYDLYEVRRIFCVPMSQQSGEVVATTCCVLDTPFLLNKLTQGRSFGRIVLAVVEVVNAILCDVVWVKKEFTFI